MKTINFTLIVFFLNFFVISGQIKYVDEKLFPTTSTKQSGDCEIIKSYIKIDSDNNLASKVFEIKVPETGEYYLNAWAFGIYDKENKTKYFDVAIDDDKEAANTLDFDENGWQDTQIKDEKGQPKKIKLETGEHTISFSCEIPVIPSIEFIRLSKDELQATISDKKYKAYMDSIKVVMEKNSKNPIATKLDSITPKSLIIDEEANYGVQTNVPVRYTYYTYLFFSEGSTLDIRTVLPSPYLYFYHVVEVFSYERPESYTWRYLYSTGGNFSINIPYSGTYIIRARSYQQNEIGGIKLYINEDSYGLVPVYSYGFRYPHDTPTTYNYFTCKLTGDSRIWIEDDSGSPGKIRAFNDDYNGDGDFNWGLASRVKKDFSVRIGAALISSYSSSNPDGSCDVYMKCQNSNIASVFPNLETDDAIQSAPTSDNYNCASWGGGRIDLGRYFWASNSPGSNNLSSDWYVSGNFWQSWDNFFGNIGEDGTSKPRFTGAPTYTRSGATSSNGEIAMWYNPNYYAQGIGDYTHFSVTKPANDQPHGYDWESKPGNGMRTFHPRDALNDNSIYAYGEISVYYKRENTTLKSYTLNESINAGLTVLQDIKLDGDEKNKITLLKTTIQTNEIETFNNKLQKLIEKMNSPEMIIQSNPGLLYKTPEFNEMLAYCKNRGEEVWPMLFENIFSDENPDKKDLSILIINEITPEYGYLMEEVKKEWQDNNYTEEGAYIAPSPIANTKNYVKKLLALKSGKTMTSTTDDMRFNNNDLFSVYPNPFNYQTTVKFNITENNSYVTLKVYSINGKLLETIVNHHHYDAGKQEVLWHADNFSPGTYVFNLTINDKAYNRRFLIE